MIRSATLIFAIVVAAVPPAEMSAQGLGSRLQLGVHGGITNPTGDFAEEAELGWHAGGLFKMRIFGPLDGRLEGAYHKPGTKTFELTGAEVSSKTKIVFGGVAAELNLGPDSAQYPGDNSVSPYLLGGIGRYQYSFEATCVGGCTGIDLTGEDRWSWGLNIGAGANVPFNRLPLYAELRYHRFGATFPSTQFDGTATMLTASLGIKLR